ncbi:MAG: efflux RND transporter permease subunit [Clostridia bacterium]
MNLPQLSIKRPVFTGVVLIILFLFGAFSLSSMQLDLLPDINLPMAIVLISYPDAGPYEVESQVTRTVEGAMATVGGVDSMQSTSYEGSSVVRVNFEWGTDLDSATFDMRESLDMIRGALPDDAEEPRVLKMDPGMMPVTTISIAGLGDLAEMQRVAEDVIVPRLERIEGVATVDIGGDREEQIQVRLDMARMHLYGIDPGTVREVLAGSNLNLPGGTIEEGSRSYTVRTMGEFVSLQDIRETVVPTSDGGTVRLDNIAQIVETTEEVKSMTRLDGEPSIALSVSKESGANTVTVSNRVDAAMEDLAGELPAGLRVAEVMDQGRFIVAAIRRVFSNAMIGGALAIAVLFAFLRDWRSTMVTALAIPFAAIVSFTFTSFAGLTMNLLSMGGLALGIGMMVDNAIVVLENVFRKLDEGGSVVAAAVEGTSEVAAAITASTLTTLSVFLPIIFTEGLAAEIFSDLSLTVSAALGASLLIALIGVPLFASRLLRQRGVEDVGTRQWHARGFPRRYGRFLEWSLQNRGWIMVFLVISLVVGAISVPFIDTAFLPQIDDGQIMVDVELPAGTALFRTDSVMEELESEYREIPEVDSILTYSGTTVGLGIGGADSATGQIQVTLVEQAQRSRTSEQVGEEIREISRDVPGCEVSVTSGMFASMAGSTLGGYGGPSIEVAFRGDDMDVLEDITDEMAQSIGEMAGTYDVRTSFDEGAPELRLVVDRLKAANLGVTPAQIAQTVRTASVGEVASRYRVTGAEKDILLIFEEDSVTDREGLLSIPIHLGGGRVVPLMEVVESQEEVGPTAIDRIDQSRSGTVTARVFGRTGSEVNAEVARIAEAMNLPPGYTVDLEGEQALIEESFGTLAWVAVLGFLLMYLIMSAQFESFAFPLSVIFTVPMSLTGIAAVLAITGRTFDVSAFVGLIVVMGIIVNNAIVMVDYANQLRRGGMPRREAMVLAGTVRMRPVLMTALTTVLAMVPLALGVGEGTEMQVPLATAVMGGLSVGTVLTLVVLPVMYTLIDDLTGGIGKESMCEGGDGE